MFRSNTYLSEPLGYGQSQPLGNGQSEHAGDGHFEFRRVRTQLGEILLAAAFGKLWAAEWADSMRNRADVWNRIHRHCAIIKSRPEPDITDADDGSILDLAQLQIKAFISGERIDFDVPFFPVGTDFQQRVWKKISDIPYGEVMSYSELAEEVGNPRALRAVASACRANSLSLLIPCHRVVGAHGSLSGYAGGSWRKQELISLENLHQQNF